MPEAPAAPYARAAVAESLRTVVTPDGRTVAFSTWGDPDGLPILGLHGTPGCRLERWPREELFRELGVYLVTHDRAGYARSDRRRGRCVADEVDDVLLLAGELGFERFAVTGGSGGGPHALACAALIPPERLLRVTCAVGIVPFGGQGLERDAARLRPAADAAAGRAAGLRRHLPRRLGARRDANPDRLNECARRGGHIHRGVRWDVETVARLIGVD